MSEDKSKTIIPKRTTKTKLASSESVLKEGEIALIYPDTGPGTGAAKLVSGDGTTVAKNLPIAIDGEAIDELRESLDIAKKIIPITLSLTGWESINGDNSAPYVQTVINEELKSSMNPDLVSMLDESATPEEQEAYNKNLAIISQGVGTVNNGSITYKVYKLPSTDITIGLTRLGGVKEVETASGVDDVKVGGVSVVNNKVAEIPAIPSANDLVPYSGAIKDVNVGNHSLVVATTKRDVLTSRTDSYSLNANVGKSDFEIPGILFNAKKDELYKNTEHPYTQITEMTITPGNFTVANHTETSSGKREFKAATLTREGFQVKSDDGSILITDTAVKELADPVDERDAANKKYVDESIAAIPKVDTSDLVPYAGATKDINLGDHTINFNTSGSLGSVPGTATINIGKFTDGTGSIPGARIEANARSTDDSLRDYLSLKISPAGISVDADHEGDTGESSTTFNIGANGISIQKNLDTEVKITADKVTGLALPTSDTDAANKQYVNLVSGGRALRQLPVKSIPKSSSLTLTIPLTLSPSPVNGYAVRVLSITILNNEEMPESMNYNYGLNTKNELFITYFNNDSTTDKTPTDKMAIIHYAYVPVDV